MVNDNKKVQALRMPWEEEYGYAQAVQYKDMVWRFSDS
jgi:hypothetical protein